MGLLERVASTRSALVRASSRAPEQRLSIDQWMQSFTFNGVSYPVVGTSDAGVTERDTTSFVGYVQQYYKDNGVIFATVLARLLLFTEARFQFQELHQGRPGDMFGNGELAVLETPWPNGTTGELLSRMEQDVSLNGNCYLVREGNRLRRLRPDWVQILLTAAPHEAVQSDIEGYIYTPGGLHSTQAPKVYLPDQVAHWSPIPDPVAQYRGMSWLTPVIREIEADRATSEHKLKFFENAATPNLAVSFPESITQAQFNAFMQAMNNAHQGTRNAYRTLYVGGGADVQVIGANMDQMDFKNTQGAGETRICAAGGVPPIIVGLSEGLASATYSNYGMARRKFGDHWARPQWRSACAALATLIKVPKDTRLWYDDRDIAFLREDQKDVAAIQTQQASTIKQLIDSGYTPESIVKAVENEDWSLLKHSGLYSVQLQPPGSGAPPAGPAGPGGAPGPPSGGAPKPPIEPKPEGEPPAPEEEGRSEYTITVNVAPGGSSADIGRLIADAIRRGEWKEGKHPRDPKGQFTDFVGSPKLQQLAKDTHNTKQKADWYRKEIAKLGPEHEFSGQYAELAKGADAYAEQLQSKHDKLKEKEYAQALETGVFPALAGNAAFDATPRLADVPDLTDDEEAALGAYAHRAYEFINASHRSGGELRDPTGEYTDSELAEYGRNMDKLFTKLPPTSKDIEVVRSTGDADQMFGPVGSKVGKSFVDRGYTSTTTDAQVLSRFSRKHKVGRAKLTIRIPAGSKALAVPNEQDEREVLVNRGGKYKVVSDRMVGKQRRIELELVP